MDRENPVEHKALEEVRMERVSAADPPDEWDPEECTEEPMQPPVLLEEDEELTLMAHHRTFWKALAEGKSTIRCLVVRSDVHIGLAHESLGNCIEEALFFDGLLRKGLVEKRSRLAQMLGYSRARITQMLNLLKLPLEIRRKVLLTDDISEFQLRPLVRMSDARRQRAMFEKLLSEKLTGREMARAAEGGEPEEAPDISRLMEEEEDKAGEPVDQEVKPDSPKAVSESFMKLLDSLGTVRGQGWQERAVAMQADDEDMALLRAVSLLRSGLYDKASRALEEFVSHYPEHPAAYFYLGRCRNLQGGLEEAESYLRNAVDLVPDSADFLVELAIVLEKQGRESEASTYYHRSSALRRGKVADIGREG
jgi:TolA-binding protein